MDQMTERPVLYLIDGSAYLYRAFFALPALSTSTGLPTNAVYGFTTMLQKIIREHRPDYLAVVFDEKGPTLRHEAFKEYKAHRPPMPDALSRQIPYIHRVVEAFAIPVVKLAGYEADDLIAEFGTSETLLTRLSEVKSDKLRGLLEAQADAARQSRQLATIVTDCPVTFERERFRLGEVRTDELSALYRELEFWGLLKTLHPQTNGETRREERVAVLNDPADRTRLVAAIKAEAAVAIHCDLAGAEPFAAAVRGVGVCAGPGQASYFPGEDGLADLRPVLEDQIGRAHV